MQTKSENIAAADRAGRIYRRIGSTTYKVGIHFSRTSKEDMNDKITRLIRNDPLNKRVE